MAKNTKSTAATNDANEMDQTAETELDRLQKQLRKMEKDFTKFMNEKKYAELKEERIIEILTKEHDSLKEEYDAQCKGPHAKRDAKLKKEITKLKEKEADLRKEIEEKKINIKEMEIHTKKLEKQIHDLEKSQPTEKLHNEQMCKIQNDILKLENQLDVVNKRCGEVTSENTNLRSSIDHLLLERAQFNGMWQKMVTQLEQGKKQILDLIEQTIAAYEQREELCNKIQNLEEKGQSENSVHLQEMRELQRKLDHDTKLQEFFAIKGNHRVNVDLEMREMNRKQMLQDQSDKENQDLQSILDNICELTAENDIEQLARYYTKQEEENFALFNYVNELSYEVEILSESVQRLHNEIEKQKVENEEKKRTQQVSTVDVLEVQLKICTEEAEKAKKAREECDKELQQVLEGIERIFRLISCDEAPTLNILRTEQKVTVHNVKLFLGIITRRYNDILNSLTCTEQPTKILAKRDRIPRFNIKDVSNTPTPRNKETTNANVDLLENLFIN